MDFPRPPLRVGDLDEAAKWTVHGSLRTDSAVLQVAVARLLGYLWPAERDDGMELADEQREWVRHCEALHAFSDKDGIVCIPAVRGEPPARERLLQLLAAAFGDAWEQRCTHQIACRGGQPELDDWLRNRFFEQHCKLFHQALLSGISGWQQGWLPLSRERA